MRFGRSSFLAIALAAVFVIEARATVLYRQTFGSDVTGGQGATSAWDWAVHTTATAVDASANTAATPAAINRTAAASKPGTTDSIGNVSSHAVVGLTPAAYGAGIAFASIGTAGQPLTGNALFWTPEYAQTSGTNAGISTDPAVNPGLAFSFYEGNANTDGGWSVAVKIGSQWYVQHTPFFNTAAVNGATATTFPSGGDDGNGGTNHGAELKTLVYSPSAANWDLLNFDGAYNLATHLGTSGTVLTRGGPAPADLSGTIDAFGLFGENGASQTGNRRFDTYTIVNSVPEPASFLSGSIGCGWLLLLRRRTIR